MGFPSAVTFAARTNERQEERSARRSKEIVTGAIAPGQRARRDEGKNMAICGAQDFMAARRRTVRGKGEGTLGGAKHATYLCATLHLVTRRHRHVSMDTQGLREEGA
jgi:hypothetical protein